MMKLLDFCNSIQVNYSTEKIEENYLYMKKDTVLDFFFW